MTLPLRDWSFPSWIFEVIAVAHAAFRLAVTLHLRNIFRDSSDRALPVLLDLLLWIVVLDMGVLASTWFAEQRGDFLTIAIAAGPNLRALAFLLVMARILLIDRPPEPRAEQEMTGL